MAAAEASAKVPITVVTGFLGAGKTTLVNHILQGSHGKKIAVIENEYGEVSIDDALVMETKEEIFEMNNGCVCCTVRGDLIRILNKLLRRRQRFDAIMIETTGLANPAPVIQTFFVDDDIKDACTLDAVLTVVDAKHIVQHLDEEKPEDVVNESVQQVAFADKILLNKLDLVTEEEKAEVIRRIRAINRGVSIIECTKAEVDVGQLVGVNAFSLDKLLEVDPDFLEGGGSHHSYEHEHQDHDHSHCDHDHGHCEAGASNGAAVEGHHKHEHHSHLDHKHDSRVTSVGLTAEGDVDMKALNGWLSKLLQEKGPDLYRSKGILSMAGDDNKYVFQGVHQMLQFSSSREGAGRPWKPDEHRVNKVVFIGKNLNRQELTDGFNACLAK